MIMGGLKGYSFTASSKWVHKAVTPKQVYKKERPEEEFKGLIFMKFGSPSDAEFAMKVLKEKLDKENVGKESKDHLWVDIEAPIEQRVCVRFLKGLRKQLLEWDFPKKAVSFDTDACTLKVEGKTVVEVVVADDAFKITWVAEQWKDWAEL